MKVKTLLIFGIGVVGGIYLSTQDGKKTKTKIKEYAFSLKPVIDDLLDKVDDLLKNISEIQYEDVKVNMEQRVDDLKNKIKSINTDSISSVAKIAIKDATKLLRKIREEVTEYSTSHFKKDGAVKYEKMPITELRKLAKKRNIKIKATDKKSEIIRKLLK